MEMCRACLSSVGKFIKLDEIVIMNYNLLTNIVVNKADGFPQSMCSTCKDAVNFFATFRSKCIESEASLQQIYAQQLVKDEENATADPATHKEVKVEAEHFETNYLEDDNYAYEFDNLDEKVKIEIDTVIDSGVKLIKKKAKGPKKKGKEKKNKTVLKKPRKTRASVVRPEAQQRKLEFYACGLCPSKFKTKPPLTEHLENHVQHLVCGICSVPFMSWEELLAHRYNHVDEDQRVCHLCERRFCNSVTQENHYLRDHSGKTLGLSCSWCDGVFQSRRKLNKHVLGHARRTYICDHCGKVFKSKSHLATHIGKHSAQKRFVCGECNKRFTYPNGLLLHRRKYHTTGIYCKVCTKVYPDQAALDRHGCRAHVICTTCGKTLLHMGLLKEHMRSHSGERPFSCDQCPVAYKSRSALAVHKNRHAGRRPYGCRHCAASFYSQSVLIKHTRIHTGEKPYVCKVCGKAFTGGHNLKVHMKVHGEMLVVSRRAPAPDGTGTSK